MLAQSAAAQGDSPLARGWAGTLAGGAAFDEAVLAEVNAARADPQGYAAQLRRYVDYFHGTIVAEPYKRRVQTREGVAAVEEAIADLERQTPAPPLRALPGLERSALRHVREQGAAGDVGHDSPDGASFDERIRAEGVEAESLRETISYGSRSARDVVRQLIVDDGVPDRGHRRALFDAGMRRAGAACGPHAGYGWMCVIDLSGSPLLASGR